MLDKILKYENGEMSDDEIIDFFQELVNKNMHMTLQGHYGRTANTLINDNFTSIRERVIKNVNR